MEQEQAFLAALQSAATFSIEGGPQLTLRTAADAIGVMMTRRVEIDLPEQAPEPSAPTGRVVGTQGLNVRTGPGTVFPVIGVARLGDEGEIIGRSADSRWWVVSVPSAPGGMGWVCGRLRAGHQRRECAGDRIPLPASAHADPRAAAAHRDPRASAARAGYPHPLG